MSYLIFIPYWFRDIRRFEKYIETDTYAYSGKIAALRAILNCTIHNKANRDFLKQYDYI